MKRRKRTQTRLSLFPFLSVLTAVIGVLTLSISVMAIGLSSNDDVQELERRESYQAQFVDVNEQLKIVSAEYDATEGLLTEAEVLRQRIAQLRQELDDLMRKQAGAKANEQECIAILDEITKIKEEICRLEKELENLRARMNELQHLQDNLPDPNTTQILPPLMSSNADNQSAGRKPYFVECRDDSIIILESNTKVGIDEIAENTAFSAYADKVKKTEAEGAILIFLIRPNGVKAFDKASSTIRKQSIRYGYLPIPNYSDIDLSSFDNN